MIREIGISECDFSAQLQASGSDNKNTKTNFLDTLLSIKETKGNNNEDLDISKGKLKSKENDDIPYVMDLNNLPIIIANNISKLNSQDLIFLKSPDNPDSASNIITNGLSPPIQNSINTNELSLLMQSNTNGLSPPLQDSIEMVKVEMIPELNSDIQVEQTVKSLITNGLSPPKQGTKSFSSNKLITVQEVENLISEIITQAEKETVNFAANGLSPPQQEFNADSEIVKALSFIGNQKQDANNQIPTLINPDRDVISYNVNNAIPKEMRNLGFEESLESNLAFKSEPVHFIENLSIDTEPNQSIQYVLQSAGKDNKPLDENEVLQILTEKLTGIVQLNDEVKEVLTKALTNEKGSFKNQDILTILKNLIIPNGEFDDKGIKEKITFKNFLKHPVEIPIVKQADNKSEAIKQIPEPNVLKIGNLVKGNKELGLGKDENDFNNNPSVLGKVVKKDMVDFANQLHANKLVTNNEFINTLDKTKVAEIPIDQISKNIAFALKEGKRELSITLLPENLGKIALHMTKDSEGISVKIVTDNKLVRDEINQQSALLAESLKEKGLKVNIIEVHYKGNSDSYNHFSGNEQQRRQPQQSDQRNQKPFAQKDFSKAMDKLYHDNIESKEGVNYFV